MPLDSLPEHPQTAQIRLPKHRLGAIVWFDDGTNVRHGRVCGVTSTSSLYSVHDDIGRARDRVDYKIVFPDTVPGTNLAIWETLHRDESGISATREEAETRLRKELQEYNDKFNLARNKIKNQPDHAT
jgi:hypothetical protein